MLLARASYGTPDFDQELARLRERGETDFAKVEPAVREILDTVRRDGDAAVRRYVERFEHRRPEELCIRDFAARDGRGALERLEPRARTALELAADRITEFHRHERNAMFPVGGFRFEDEGRMLGLRIRPLARVGVYAPGGKARYPSSVLMSAI